MVELQALHPFFLGDNEIAEDVIRRERPAVVVIDCDHQDCTDSLLAAVREVGSKPILFSPFRFEREVNRVAQKHGVDSFTLPADPENFGRLLQI